MSLNKNEVEKYIEKYVKDYPINKHLHFKVRDTGSELYGDNADERYKTAKASYKPYQSVIDGRYGRIDIVANNNHSYLDLRRSLNHEIIGHYGLNTLEPDDKKLLLDSIINNRDNLSDLWDDVDRAYSDEPLYLKAEEVFCLVVEEIDPSMHRGKIAEKHNLTQLDVKSLKNLALDIAEGITNHELQKTFMHQDVTRIQYELSRQLEEPEQENDLDR